METATAQEDGSLTLKKLQNHLIKTMAGALAVALIGAFITSYGFYYHTTDSIEELNNSKTESRQDIKDLKIDVNEIKTSLSNTGIYTNNNKEDIKTLRQDVNDIKKSQDEMLKVLYEIKSKQK